MRCFRGMLASVAVIGLLACGGDDDGDGGTGPGDEGLNATFQMVSLAGQPLPIAVDDGVELVAGTIDFDADGDVTVAFDYDGDTDESITGEYVLDGDEVTMTFDDAGEAVVIEGVIDGDELTVDIFGAPAVFER